MFLKRNQRNGHHFLILMSCGDLPMRGLVTRTMLYQCGQFMMGHVTFTGTKTVSFADGPERKEKWKHRVTLSGTYGGDGLSREVPREVYDKGTDVPAELVEAWSKGGGWNGAGSEGPAMREWGLSLMRKEAEAKARKPRPPATGRMNAEAAHRFWVRKRGEAQSHVRRCITEQWTAEEERNRWADNVRGYTDWERAPAWVGLRLDAYHECFRDMLYAHHLDWRTWTNGHGLMTKAEHREGEKAGKWTWQDTDPERGAHCWASTGKVWYGPEKKGGCPKCGSEGTTQGELNGYSHYCLTCSMGFNKGEVA